MRPSTQVPLPGKALPFPGPLAAPTLSLVTLNAGGGPGLCELLNSERLLDADVLHIQETRLDAFRSGRAVQATWLLASTMNEGDDHHGPQRLC